MKLSGTHCSSLRLSHLRSHSGCHTSSGLGCSCYSRSEIHEVHRSFHLFHREQKKKDTGKKMASKNMNINTVLCIVFSVRNHHFLRVSLSRSDTEFKTQCALQRLIHCKTKHLTAPTILLYGFVSRRWRCSVTLIYIALKALLSYLYTFVTFCTC